MVRQVTPRQIELLLDFLEEHRSLALGKVRGREGNALSKRLWRECAQILNADAGGAQKTAPEWKTYYNQYKSRTKAKYRQIKEARNRTGGGPLKDQELFPLEDRLISIVGGCNSPLPAVRHNPFPDQISFPAPLSSDGDIDDIELVPMAQQGTAEPMPTDEQTFFEFRDIALETLSPYSPENGVAVASNVSQSRMRTVRNSDERPPRRHRRRRRPSSPKDNSIFEAAQQRLASMEESRIEVDREIARAVNRNASAMELIAEAAFRYVGLYEQTLRRRRRRISSASSNDGVDN